MANRTSLEGLEKILGHIFKDKTLLDQALTHGSASKQCNERLEFLGDSVLGMIIASAIYERYPTLPEGAMSRLRASLVNGKQLAELGKALNLGDYLRLGYGERKSGGADRASSLADAVEAIVAALYLDAGFAAAQQVVLQWFAPLWDTAECHSEKDAKSRLQEWLQAKRMPLPVYTLIATHGHAHEARFEIQCSVEGLPYVTTATNSTRRSAEQTTAADFLLWLTNNVK
jgi:ribonuclease-3